MDNDKESREIPNQFYVVSILDAGANYKNFDVIVPTEYLFSKNEKYFVKYMILPYTPDDLACIQSFVEAKAEPPKKGWASYKCHLKGYGPTYADVSAWLMEHKTRSHEKNNNQNEPVTVAKKTMDELYDVPDLADEFETSQVSMNRTNLDETMNSIESMSNAENKQSQTGISEMSLVKKIQELLKTENQELKKAFIPRFRSLESEVKELKSLIHSLEKKKNKDILVFMEFCKLYEHINFPLEDLESFEKLNKEIDGNTANIANYIERCLITDIYIKIEVADNMSDILRKLFSKDLLMKYTALFPRPNKSVFKNTTFYKKMEAAFIKAYSQEISSSSVEKALSKVFHNIKDWKGERTERAKRTG